MTDYLARLKARSGQKHLPDEPPKLTKPGFVGFDSDLGGHFSQATRVAASVPSLPSSVVMAPPDTEPTDARGHSVARWTETYEERAAVVEFDGGAPHEWAEGFASLDRARPPDDVPARRWLRFIDDCGQFLDDGWAARAAALGWGPLDLFGCNRDRPFARIDHQGLLWLLNGNKVIALAAETAIIETPINVRKTYRRRAEQLGHMVLAWELAP